MNARAYLTKSRYMKGRTCQKRLWSLVHAPAPDDGGGPDAAAAAGVRVGAAARLRFPGGRLVDAEPYEHAKAVKDTAALMADKSVPAVFEAAFEHNGAHVRCDVLERGPRGRWNLYEVKSSKKPADDHLYDLAFQVCVLRGAGVNLGRFGVLHINGDYVRGKRGLDMDGFFTFADLTKSKNMPFEEAEKDTPAFLKTLRKRKAPDIGPGRHCPPGCEFLSRCEADKPDDWIKRLPRISEKTFNKLSDLGVESIADIPKDFGLTADQNTVREVCATGRDYISPDLPKLLRGMGPPAFYLDFETVSPAVPLYPGASPYQMFPFQWSVHHVSRAGKLRHYEFLADGRTDPRRELTESLLHVLAGKKAPVLAYSSYEKTVLGGLKAAFPDLARGVDDVLKRLMDLKTAVNGTYLRAYNFSKSLKNAAPALAPDIGYDDLDGVHEGAGAAGAFERIVLGELAEGETETALREQLLQYCGRDTLAMVKIHAALIKRAEKLKKRR